MNKLICLVLAAAGGWAQEIPASFYQSMEWRNIGPFRGGRSDAVAGVPSKPRLYYFGGVGGGVWKNAAWYRWWCQAKCVNLFPKSSQT